MNNLGREAVCCNDWFGGLAAVVGVPPAHAHQYLRPFEVEGQVRVDCTSSRSNKISLASFSRKGRPFLKVGYCSFMASKPTTPMTGTRRSPSGATSSANEPGGNRQSDHRPAGDAKPSGPRVKNALLKRTEREDIRNLVNQCYLGFVIHMPSLIERTSPMGRKFSRM